MKYSNHIFAQFSCFGGLLCLMLSLSSCFFAKHIHPIHVNIQAARYLNPDIHGEPSPVRLTFYELRNNTLFDKVEFFTLQDNSAAALQQTLIDQRSLMIRPKMQMNFTYQLSDDARYLGIVVSYRQLLYSEWKKIIVLYEKPVKHLKIFLASNSFVIN